jgi:outer membrane protease
MKVLKTGVLVLVLVATSQVAGAEPRSWKVDVEVSTGLRAGVMGEYVYASMSTLSNLRWELLPLITVGTGVVMQTPWGTQVSGTVAFPANRYAGHMTNSDYEDPSDPSIRTRVSRHNAFVDSYRSVNGELSQDVLSAGIGNFAVGVGYRDRFVKMIAQDGTYDYGTTSGDVSGVAITYQQHHRIPYALVSARARSTDDFEVVTKLSMAPYIFVDALDHHHRRLLDFHDTVRGAYWIEGEVGLAFTLWGQSVEITGFGEFIPETKGDTYTVDYNTNSFEGVTGPTVFDGAGISWWNAGVYVTLRYGW